MNCCSPRCAATLRNPTWISTLYCRGSFLVLIRFPVVPPSLLLGTLDVHSFLAPLCLPVVPPSVVLSCAERVLSSQPGQRQEAAPPVQDEHFTPALLVFPKIFFSCLTIIIIVDLFFQDTHVPLEIFNATMGFVSRTDCGVMAISTALTNPTKRTAHVSPRTSCAHLESASRPSSSVMGKKIAAMVQTKRTVV